MTESTLPTRRSFWAGYISIMSTVVFLDQGTKALITGNMELYQGIRIAPFLNFVYAFNEGAAFGFGSDFGLNSNLIFLILGFAILCVLIYLVWSSRHIRSQLNLAYSLVAGGAAGNLIDRLIYGHVIDFLDFHYAGWHFWTFNIADSAITIGAILLIMDLLGIRLFFRQSENST